ncbi:uncharacterized protein LOC131236957 isoform X1 [Magnolia sinica]|uniref:uncharacterized protein LOC131236957 isoform X1 n=1 Tax=Magnolia sinica TaxID=86752 RepID=UPI00265A6FD1|nr:uncharacterized protein LOC131236957 isoform X1 [Magnolia sinica]
MQSPSPSLTHLFLFFFFFFFFLFFFCIREASAAAKAPMPVGNISTVEDAEYFHIYYGQTFKVIKNGVDGKSYLLIQSNSRMAIKTKYCTGRIKSFIIPLANYSVDPTDFPVSFFELLGLVENLKGITTDGVISKCILKSYMDGNIAIVNKTDTSQITQFAAHFVSYTDGQQSCNFVTIAPAEEDTPLQRAEWIKYLGTYANLEARANQVFDAIKGNYICLSKTAASKAAPFKPVVAWLQYNEGVWSFTKEEYKLKYVEDAGGEILDESISRNTYNVSIPDDLDNFHAILCTIDVVIDETYAPDPSQYNVSTFTNNVNVADNSCFAFLTNQSLWRYDKRMRDSSPLGKPTNLYLALSMPGPLANYPAQQVLRSRKGPFSAL